MWLIASFNCRESTSQQSRNPFVQTALAYALSYATSVHSFTIETTQITILADADYYSHSGNSSSEHSPNPSRFRNFNRPLNEVPKTGLGSSAALVTAFTAAVIAHYVPTDVLDTKSQSGQSRLHNLAQAAHCAAQGKIGSGFDVAAAVYGSCSYRRFSPLILEHLGESGQDGFSQQLRSAVEDDDSNNKWNMAIDKSTACIPKGLLLLMCDVESGSETVGMVKMVLEWRTRNAAEAALLWATLQTANDDLSARFRGMVSKGTYSSDDLSGVRTTILTIRSLIREMSKKSGVPIEPPVQTALIDACSDLPGVVGGVVPGAGGYDAIALLVEDQKEAVDGLRTFLCNYHAEAKDQDAARIGSVRLLGVKQEDQGMKEEDPTNYQTWV